MGAKKEDRHLSTGHMTKEERTRYAMETTMKVKEGKTTPTNQLAKSNYLDRPETREFHSIVRRKSMFANRTCLNSVDDMKNEILEYFDLCDKYDVTPVVVGLANFLGLSKRHLYEIGNDSSEFSPIVQKAIEFIAEMQEDAALRNSINSVAWIFTAKNHLGMSDNQTITLKPDTGEAQNRADTLNALQEVVAQQNQQLLEEKTTNDYGND